VQDVLLTNNLYYGNTTSVSSGISPVFELGCHAAVWIHGVRIANNTVVGATYGMLGIGDYQDNYANTTITDLRCENNIAMNGTYGMARALDTTLERTLAHIPVLDNCVFYNNTSGIGNRITRTGTFARARTNYNLDGTRAVTGVALYDSSAATLSSFSLAFTYTLATNQTLQFGSGTGVSVVFDSGTFSSTGQGTVVGGTNGIYGLRGGTIADSSKTSWTSNYNANCPTGMWLMVTSGQTAGYKGIITSFNTTGAVMTVAPLWMPKGTITALSASGVNPCVVTSAGHGRTTGQVVDIRGATGCTAANGTWTITVIDANTFSIPVASSGSYNPASNGYAGWSLPPQSGDSYAIIKPEVTLTDGSGNTVKCGVYLPGLPTSSQTDSGITFADHSLTSNPNLINASGNLDGSGNVLATSYRLQAGSPAINAGISTDAPNHDYFATSRPQGSGYDIGFHELVSAAMSSIIVLMSLSSRTA
jgi:hypothetical protein